MGDLDVRVLADDLTGALDSAVAFCTPAAGIGVSWWPRAAERRRLAIDLATREGSEADAVGRHLAQASWLFEGETSFKKIDSLLRGHVIAEIVAVARGQAYDRLIVAPAFPFQKGVTLAGRQWRLDRSSPEMAGPDLVAGLGAWRRTGVARPGDAPAHPVTVYDARDDADLDRIVESALGAGGKTLWIGTGGLAAALARRAGVPPRLKPVLPAPLLALVGTDHEVTRGQAAHFARARPEGCFHVGDDVTADRLLIAQRIALGAPSLVTVDAAGTRREAASRIGRVLAQLLDALPRPGVLLVTGGETLRSVCDSLGTAYLSIENEVEPGIPVFRMVGGDFDGQLTLSKSGGFGTPDLLCRLAGSS
jgi:uncharacterized protein YgbK (DUF1537 family)